ncbi:MAG: hypothetical protein RI963_3176 [Planctomycetota bacterium]
MVATHPSPPDFSTRRTMNFLSHAVRPIFLASLVTFVAPYAAGEEPIRFNRDIRPILSDNCFYCHGPDKNKREAELRLDSHEGLHGTGGEPGALIPGKPDDSPMLHRILSTDPDEQMPPPETGKSLTPEQVALIRRWIAEGADFQGHWSFLPRDLSATDPAESKGPSEGEHNEQQAVDRQMTARIDALVAQGLQSQKLSPAPEADRVTLLRRLHFDLTGLPPSEAEVEAFVNDTSPDAYASLVDRLLASPHYGERMAMWWLDLVRYADTVGYHGDQEMSVSPFRDYVIASFNANKPFDQFTIEQLAGDLLPDATREQRIASGYNRLGMMSAEGGVQDKEYLAKYMSERVRNATGTWLGITLGCAECHDHKFDPFSAKDFYRFGAFFADIKERGLYSGAHADGNWGPFIKVPTPDQEARRDQFDAELKVARDELQKTTPELLAEFAAWEAGQVMWETLRPESIISLEGVTLKPQPDGSILASGKNPATDSYLLTIGKLPPKVTAFRLEVLPDDSFPRRGPGRAGNGNFVLSEFVVHHRPAAGETLPVALQNPSATYEQTGAITDNPYGKWPIAAALDGDAKGRKWGWAVMEQVGQPHAAVFETASDLTLADGDSVSIGLWQNLDNPQHTIGRFRLSVTTAPRPVKISDSIPPAIRAILEIAKGQRTEAQTSELLAHYRTIAPILEPQRKKVAELEKARGELEAAMVSTLVTEQVEPRMVRVLARGNWMDESGEVVQPAFPEVLALAPTPADRRLTRIDLARWITDPAHPLTSRVLANRLWKNLFGAGLSAKLDDLGAQGEWPSHPQLLDELAQWMVDSNWDLKRWIRSVVMSRTYRQSSLASPEARQIDPYNRLLARQARFRLDAEFVRDNALSISGLLVNKLGGKSVRPYQPPGYWAYLNFPQREWQNGSGEELYRRGLYTHWQRQYLHPSLLVFDAPSREECTAERARSNTPLQSLVLLNDPSYVEAARAFAEVVLRAEGDDSRKLDLAFRRALSRPITPEESELLTKLLQSQIDHYRQHPEAAKELLTTGARPSATDIDPVVLAGWTTVARAILNLHEVISRY